MPDKNMGRWRAAVLLGLISLPFILNVWTLKNGHNWGDDFAQYILYAQNLMAGRPLTEGIMVDLPVVYPPFYAVILIPCLYVFGMNFIVLKMLNVVFWGFLVWGAYRFFRLKGDDHALRNTVLVAWSSYFFYYKQNVLSDIFFSALVLWAILAYEYFQKNSRDKLLYAFIGAAVLACLTRSAGFCLLAAAIIHLVAGKQYRQARLVFVAMLLTAVFQRVCLGGGEGYWPLILAHPWTSLRQIIHQAPLALKALFWVFVPGQGLISSALNRCMAGALDAAGYLVPLILILVLVKKGVSRSLSFTGIFFGVYMAAAYVWAFFPEPAFALSRILLPVYVMAVFYLFDFLKTVSAHVCHQRMLLANVVFALVLALNGLNILFIYNFNDDVLFRRDNQELFSWVRQHIPRDEVVMFSKPRALKLMTGNLAASLMDQGPHDLEAKVYRLHARYIILVARDNLADISFKFITASPERFKPVWSNGGYVIFKVLDVPGQAQKVSAGRGDLW